MLLFLPRMEWFWPEIVFEAWVWGLLIEDWGKVGRRGNEGGDGVREEVGRDGEVGGRMGGEKTVGRLEWGLEIGRYALKVGSADDSIYTSDFVFKADIG